MILGGGTTDIAILSLNDIVTSDSVRIAGNVFDQDIIKYIREKYKLLIGEQTAEEIKIEFANIFNPDKKHKLEVRGRDLVTGLPSTIEITEEETEEALRESITKIIKAVTAVLEQNSSRVIRRHCGKRYYFNWWWFYVEWTCSITKRKVKGTCFHCG